METFSHSNSIAAIGEATSVKETLNTSNNISRLANYLKLTTPNHYPKVSIKLLSYLAKFAIAAPLVISLLFLIADISINFYPFFTLFFAGAIGQYLTQKQFYIIGAVVILTGLILTGIMLLLPIEQIFYNSYLFIVIPFISAFLLHPKNQLHLFFALSALCLFLFADAITLFSDLLFSSTVNGALVLKMSISIFVCLFVCFISNYIALYIQENETRKLDLVSEVALGKAAIKNFSGIAAHDLREPLQTLTGYSNLLKRSLDEKENLTEVEKDFFKLMDESTKRMLSMLDDLSIFSVSKVATESKVPVDLNLVIQAVKKNLLFTIANTSTRVRVGDLPTIKANINPMLHLFQNIISNAIKYQPKNEEPHIPIVNINAAVNKKYHIIYITDNGIGIPKNRLQYIFEPLKRLHSRSEYKGTGLGLSICKSIAEKYNGKIEVSSVYGNGTTFAVFMPIEK